MKSGTASTKDFSASTKDFSLVWCLCHNSPQSISSPLRDVACWARDKRTFPLAGRIRAGSMSDADLFKIRISLPRLRVLMLRCRCGVGLLRVAG